MTDKLTKLIRRANRSLAIVLGMMPEIKPVKPKAKRRKAA